MWRQAQRLCVGLGGGGRVPGGNSRLCAQHRRRNGCSVAAVRSSLTNVLRLRLDAL